MSSALFKNCYLQGICLQIIYLIYMYKQDLALNNLQGLIMSQNTTKQPILKKFL